MKPWKRFGTLFGAIALTAGCTSSIPSVDQTISTSAASPSARAEITISSSEPVPSSTVNSTDSPAGTPAGDLRLDPTMIILDASGSMTTDDAPGQRIQAAKNAVMTLVDGLSDNDPVGLIAYGTGTDSSDAAKTLGCQDVKLLVPLGPVDKDGFIAAANAVTASGYTPIGAALKAAAAQLPTDGPRNIVLISDGEDTCAPPDPCEVAKEIHSATADLAIHAVGFRVSGAAKDQLSCIASAGGGTYVDAANAVQLRARLRSVTDPNTAVNTLTGTGFSVMKIGMTVAEAQSADPSISAPANGTVTIVWRDCDLTFTDGTLVSIAPHNPTPTQDGLAVGDDIGEAEQLYGSTVAVTDNGITHGIFAAADGSEVGYDVAFTPSPSAAAGELSGPITTISICRCRPSESGQAPAPVQSSAPSAVPSEEQSEGPNCPSDLWTIWTVGTTTGGWAKICQNPTAAAGKRDRLVTTASEDAYHSGEVQKTYSGDLERKDGDATLCGVSEGYEICINRAQVTFTLYGNVEFQSPVLTSWRGGE